MKKYILDIQSFGAEITVGLIEDENEKEFILEQIENDEVYPDMYSDNIDISHSNYDQIIGCYGPDISQGCERLTLSEYIEDKIVNTIDLDLNLNVFTYSNPDYYNVNNKNSLMFAIAITEKRIHYPVIIELEDHETFDIDNVFIGTLNTDETIESFEIIYNVYYLRNKDKNKILKEYLEDNFIENDFELLIEALAELDKTILKPFLCDNLDIEGKGESEETFIRIIDLNEDIELFSR